jgi:anaerobic selenocysteine-containing dehydrogenase
VGKYRPLWASPEVEISPAMKFLAAEQHVELSPDDAQRLGVAHGENVEVAANGTAIRATVAVRTGVVAGTAFLADGLATDSANALSGEIVEIRPTLDRNGQIKPIYGAFPAHSGSDADS